MQSTPISIAVLSGDELEELGINQSQEMDNFIPNVQLDTATGSGGTAATFSIRGIGTYRSAPTSQSTVPVYVDDIFLPGFEAGMINLLDLERVEILRGPQGTLFGRNAVAGAIHYISKRPDSDDLYGRIKATGGENGRANVDVAVNVPFNDRFAGRFALSDTNVDAGRARMSLSLFAGP